MPRAWSPPSQVFVSCDQCAEPHLYDLTNTEVERGAFNDFVRCDYQCAKCGTPNEFVLDVSTPPPTDVP